MHFDGFFSKLLSLLHLGTVTDWLKLLRVGIKGHKSMSLHDRVYAIKYQLDAQSSSNSILSGYLQSSAYLQYNYAQTLHLDPSLYGKSKVYVTWDIFGNVHGVRLNTLNQSILAARPSLICFLEWPNYC